MKDVRRIPVTVVLAAFVALAVLQGATADAEVARARPVGGCDGEIVPTPQPGQWPTRLNAVAVAAVDDVWAVGARRNSSGADQTMAMHWDGHEWSIIRTPNVNTNHDNTLLAVSVATNRRVWAVGYANDDSIVAHPLVMLWNGNRWAIQDTEGLGTGELHGVAPITTRAVWVVGSRLDETGNRRTLTAFWNGNEWIEIDSPNVGTGPNRLEAVSADDSGVWAVGSYFDFTLNTARALSMRHSGTTWALGDVAGNGRGLAGVKAYSASSAWAVGSQSGAGAGRTLVVRRTGSVWQDVDSEDVGNGTNALAAVDAYSFDSGNVWAAGHYFNAGGFARTLVERYNGSTWDRSRSQNRGTRSNFLNGIAGDPAGGAWAVGYFFNSSNLSRSLIERFC